MHSNQNPRYNIITLWNKDQLIFIAIYKVYLILLSKYPSYVWKNWKWNPCFSQIHILSTKKYNDRIIVLLFIIISTICHILLNSYQELSQNIWHKIVFTMELIFYILHYKHFNSFCFKCRQSICLISWKEVDRYVDQSIWTKK